MLEAESTNVKALYRRAQAYMNMADLDMAEFDVRKALEIDPNNRYCVISRCPNLLHLFRVVISCNSPSKSIASLSGCYKL